MRHAIRWRHVLVIVVTSLAALLALSVLNQNTMLKSLQFGRNDRAKLSWNEIFGQISQEKASAVSIVLETSADSTDLGSTLSLLAFAKMLQLEALERYDLETELVLAAELNILLRDCFPEITSNTRVLVDQNYLGLLKAEQSRKLGGKSALLEPTGDVWEDSLALIDEMDSKSSIQIQGEVSSPFLFVSERQTPSIHQWQRLQQLVNFLRMDEKKCCTLPDPLPSESILLLEDDNRLNRQQISNFFSRDHKRRHVTIIHDHAVPHLFPWMREANLVPNSIHNRIPGAFSAVARFCFARRSRGELVGLWEDAPLTMWAAFSNHFNSMESPTPIRLLGTKIPPTVSYDNDDPRSAISFELIPSSLPDFATMQSSEIFGGAKVQVDNPRKETDSAADGRDKPPSIVLGTTSAPVTIVIRTTGEMGNLMSKITYGYGLQWMLLEDYNISTKIMLQHQKLSKWREASRNVQRCFPSAREWDFEAANTVEFEDREREQKTWMRDNFDFFYFKSVCELDCIKEKMSYILEHLNDSNGKPVTQEKYNITLPYISADDYATISYFNNRYASRILDMWKYDVENPECCAIKADGDEAVFHIRGFLGEMPRKGRRLGYEELSPAKIANELMGKVEAGDKIAFAGRLPSQYTMNFTIALEDRGLKVRRIENQSPNQDFCFLLSATNDFAGSAMSSYSVWAAYLGNATRARLYSVKSPDRIARFGRDGYFVRYNWTATEMERVVFEEYNSEDQDLLEQSYISGSLRRHK